MKLGQINNYAGQTISLNQSVAAYFGIGEGSKPIIWLNKNNWCATVPSNLTSNEVKAIDDAMNIGTIVLGEEWIPALVKDTSIRDEYKNIVANSRFLTDEVKDQFKELVLKKADGNYTASEIIAYVMNNERTSRGRTNYLTFLQEALEHYDGPAELVSDGPPTPEGFVGTDEMLIVEDDTKDILSPPVKSKVPSEDKQKALDKLFKTDVI